MLKRAFLLLILCLTVCWTNFSPTISAETVASPQEIDVSLKDDSTSHFKLEEYYSFVFDGKHYSIAVEKYKGGKKGKITFKLKDTQKAATFLVKANPTEYKCKVAEKVSGLYGIKQWSSDFSISYGQGSLMHAFVMAACAVARETGCVMTSEEVGKLTMQYKVVPKKESVSSFSLIFANDGEEMEVLP